VCRNIKGTADFIAAAERKRPIKIEVKVTGIDRNSAPTVLQLILIMIESVDGLFSLGLDILIGLDLYFLYKLVHDESAGLGLTIELLHIMVLEGSEFLLNKFAAAQGPRTSRFQGLGPGDSGGLQGRSAGLALLGGLFMG
jgi:hypothetical protein